MQKLYFLHNDKKSPVTKGNVLKMTFCIFKVSLLLIFQGFFKKKTYFQGFQVQVFRFQEFQGFQGPADTLY